MSGALPTEIPENSRGVTPITVKEIWLTRISHRAGPVSKGGESK
jgi:hypothetical protein